MSEFDKWIINKYVSKNSDEKYTHLLLNGGSLHIKEEHQEKFYEMYNKAYKIQDLYIVEIRNETFNLFFDLDFLISNDELEYEEYNEKINEYIFEINKFINELYQIEYKLIITNAADKNIIKNEKNLIKKGYHLHFKNIIINVEKVLEIRKILIKKIKMIYGDPFENSINDIIDASVFTKSGLRLTGSKKLNEGREYNLFKVLNNNLIDDVEYYNILLNNSLKLIKETSIITFIKEITKIDGIIPCLPCEDSEEENEEESEKNIGSWIRLSSSSNEYLEIIRFFKNKKFKEYSVNDIKRIFKSNDGKIYNIWTKSKFCQNINRNHNSCGIFFRIDYNGLCQKCFCKCDTTEGRKYGYCKDYSSNYIELSPLLQKLLFNNQKDKCEINITKINQIDEFRTLLYNNFTNKSPIKLKNKGSRKN